MMEKVIQIRMSAAEKAAFGSAALAQGLSLSEWLRQAGRLRLEDELAVTVGVTFDPDTNGHLADVEFSWD